MAWKTQKSHSAAQYKILDLAEAGYGGLNINDLDYTLPLNQSPRMLNMMVKNGAFGKRYGQKSVHEFSGEIKAMAKYKDNLYFHVGTTLVKWDGTTETEIYSSNDLEATGLFINYNKMLYYMSSTIYLEYDGTTCSEVELYCPDVLINRTPDGSYSDTIEDYNRMGGGFKNTFSADGTSTSYFIAIPQESDDDDRPLDDTPIKVTIDTTDYVEGDDTGKIVSVDRTTGEVVFDEAPQSGTNNVIITAYKTYSSEASVIRSCKYYAVFGGQNNSRLFLAGCGTATYFFSAVFDASYFPENNYAVVGNSEEDVTGFGAQYNVLVAFKPNEMYAIQYDFTEDEDGYEVARFYTAQINVEMGCDCPATIHYVDNRLTWVSTDWGVCTLCSTVIQDERNVRVISRNINGGYRASGLLSEANLNNAIGVNFEGRYIVCVNGNAYAWDYTNSPYSTSERITIDYAAKQLAWFKWNNINITCYKVLDRKIYYAYGNRLSTFTSECNDYGEIIPSYYRTPMMDFSAYHMLKTIKKVFFEVRGDTPTTISIKYITDETANGESDPEDIEINGKLWEKFLWTTFGWGFVNFAKTFARKCSIKKVALFGIELSNNELNKDMSLSGIKCEYTLVKEIK